MLWLLRRSACIGSRLPLFPTLPTLLPVEFGIWEGTWPGQLTPTNQRDTPCRMMLCSAIKLVSRKGWGGCCLQSWLLETDWASICMWALVSDCLSITVFVFFGGFVCFVCCCCLFAGVLNFFILPYYILLFLTCFALIINPSLSQPMSFLSFVSYCLPCPAGEGDGGVSSQLCGCLSAGHGQHNSGMGEKYIRSTILE